MLLLHGTADNSVPCENAVAFSTLLKVCGASHVAAVHPVRQWFGKASQPELMSQDGMHVLTTAPKPLRRREGCMPAVEKRRGKGGIRHQQPVTDPYLETKQAHALAQAGGVDSEVKLYVGKTHTQPLIEDPMSGGRDVLTDEILSVVRISQVIVPQEADVCDLALHLNLTVDPSGDAASGAVWLSSIDCCAGHHCHACIGSKELQCDGHSRH